MKGAGKPGQGMMATRLWQKSDIIIADLFPPTTLAYAEVANPDPIHHPIPPCTHPKKRAVGTRGRFSQPPAFGLTYIPNQNII